MSIRRVYIETSVISYLTARPSREVIGLACQQVTQSWWDSGRIAVASYISPYVVMEASAGDPKAAEKRIEALRDIPVLPILPETIDLAEFLLLGGGLPAKARIDALHVACAARHEVDILLTWNCTHLANPVQLPVMRGLCSAKGYKLPEVITPFEMMEALP
jgi:predicted nucleic acid-binding protein